MTSIYEQKARMRLVEARNALREICDSAAMSSAEDCRAVAEEDLRNIARSPIEEPQRGDTDGAEQRDTSLTPQIDHEARARELYEAFRSHVVAIRNQEKANG